MSQKKAFDKVFPDGVMFKSALDDTVIQGHTDRMKIQSALWKFYLLFWKPGMDDIMRSNTWVDILKQKRNEFQMLKDKFLKEAPADSGVDPLEIGTDSTVWSDYFADEQLKSSVKMDVLRLYPNHPFFSNSKQESASDTLGNRHLNAILNLVFLHLRENPNIPYWQGYHELCGLTYYLLKQEMRCPPVDPDHPDYNYHLLFENTPDAIEADTYWLYSRILEFVAPLYQVGCSISLFDRCSAIQNKLIRKYDEELADRLVEFDVLPMYSQPWLHLLFSRVFPIPEALKTWTKFWVFAPDVTIIEEMCAIVVLSQKKQIMAALDKTQIMHILWHLEMEDATPLIRQAISHVRALHPVGSDHPNKAEPICVEMERWLGKCETASKSEVIEALSSFRDAWRTLTASHVTDSLMESVDTNLLSSLTSGSPACDSVDIVPPEPMLPKASGEKVTNMDILTEEQEERQRPKQDLFADKAKTHNLFE